VPPHRGCAFAEAFGHVAEVNGAQRGLASRVDGVLRDERPLLRHGPQQSWPLPGHGPGDHRGVWPACPQAPVTLPQSDWGLPTAGLDPFGLFCQLAWHRSAALGGRAIGPGHFDQAAAGMRGARRGHGALAPLRPRGMCRGKQAQTLPPCAWAVNPGPIPHCCAQRHGDRAWHPPQGLKRCDHRRQTPGCAVLVAFLCEPREACGILLPRTDLCWHDAGLRRGGPDDLREPPQMGQPPMGPAGVTPIVSEQQGCETHLGVLQLAARICPCLCEVAPRCLVDPGDLHCGESPRAGQPGQWPRIPTVGWHAIAGFWGHQCRGHDPAVGPLRHEIPRAPGATGASVVDEEEMFGVRLHLTHEVIDIPLACPNRSELGDRSPIILRHVGDSTRVVVDIHAQEECARLRHG
jgi:hypothetical protein